MFPQDDDEMMDMEQFGAAGEPMPAAQPAEPMGMRQFYGQQIGLGQPATNVSPEELADLLGPAEGYSDYGAAPEWGEEPMPLGSELGAPGELSGSLDPTSLRAEQDQNAPTEDVKKDLRAMLLQRAKDRAALSESYQDQSDELGE